MSTYLGIDWGTKKIGLALAHDETRVAVAYATIPNDATLWRTLKDILRKEAVDSVVVGISSRRGSDATQHPVQGFAQQLREKCGVVVVLTDEMFTSKLAQELMKERGEKQVMAHDDAEAAKLLLQEWLERPNKL
ncbi:MAG: Holliday junction resolvase RuvX [Candidatus Moraniibacteriota bacterium]|nr:MAG: Holliday junction resolvase RuvX [Candidatus Moranbacteria bacterium]